MTDIDAVEAALKEFYIHPYREVLNTKADPFSSKIEKSNKNVEGKTIKRLSKIGLNGGVGAGTESGALPSAGENLYKTLESSTKNLFGRIELTDKVIKASRSNVGSFLRILEAELTSLTKTAKRNVSRQTYGDGTGKLGTITANVTESNTLTMVEGTNMYCLTPGLTIDIRNSSGAIVTGGGARRILDFDIANRTVLINGAAIAISSGDILTVQGSYNLEITGLGAIMASSGDLYGLHKSENKAWLIPYLSTMEDIADSKIQRMIDEVAARNGSEIDLINCALGVYRAYYDYLESTKRQINTLKLSGGFTALDFGGIAMARTEFMPAGTMDFYQSSDFGFDQMGDWDWFENENGRALTRVPGYPTFEAAIVKYCDLMCDCPGGQARLTSVPEA